MLPKLFFQTGPISNKIYGKKIFETFLGTIFQISWEKISRKLIMKLFRDISMEIFQEIFYQNNSLKFLRKVIRKISKKSSCICFKIFSENLSNCFLKSVFLIRLKSIFPEIYFNKIFLGKNNFVHKSFCGKQFQ